MTSQLDLDLLVEADEWLSEIADDYAHGVPLGYEDISFALGISKVKVKSACETGLRKLRRACKRYGIDIADVIGRPAHHMVEAEMWAVDWS